MNDYKEKEKLIINVPRRISRGPVRASAMVGSFKDISKQETLSMVNRGIVSYKEIILFQCEVKFIKCGESFVSG